MIEMFSLTITRLVNGRLCDVPLRLGIRSVIHRSLRVSSIGTKGMNLHVPLTVSQGFIGKDEILQTGGKRTKFTNDLDSEVREKFRSHVLFMVTRPLYDTTQLNQDSKGPPSLSETNPVGRLVLVVFLQAFQKYK